MDTSEVIKLILSGTAAITVIFGGIGFAIYTYRKSGRQERKDVTETADTIADFWKKQAEELKLILQTKDTEFSSKLADVTKDYTAQITALTEKVGILTGQLAAEKSANERLEKIFQNRSPELDAFMKYIMTASEKHTETHSAMLKALGDLHEAILKGRSIQ